MPKHCVQIINLCARQKQKNQINVCPMIARLSSCDQITEAEYFELVQGHNGQ